MGVGYILVNHTRREKIMFLHVAASTACEIAGNPAAAAITAWYLLQHPGDDIAFVTDTHGDWPFRSGRVSDLESYAEVTDRVVEQLIEAEVLADCGKSFIDPVKPDTVYVRDLRNVWWTDTPN